MSECGSKNCGGAANSITLSEPKAADARLTRALYHIENMDCPTEEALIRGSCQDSCRLYLIGLWLAWG